MRLPLLLIPAVILILAADDAATDGKNLQGTWGVVTFEAAGQKKPTDEQLMTMKFVFKDATLTRQAGKLEEKGTFKLDLTKKPKEMDLTGREGKEAALFIYELDGDSLKLCWNRPGGVRPTAFTAKNTAGMLVLRREKKE